MYLKANLNIYSNVVQNTLNDNLKGLLGFSSTLFTEVHRNLRKILFNFTINNFNVLNLHHPTFTEMLADLHNYMIVKS